MRKILIGYIILPLLLGFSLGGVLGLRTQPSPREQSPEKERFGMQRQMKALEKGGHSFYERLRSGKLDYNEELFKLLNKEPSFNDPVHAKISLLLTDWGSKYPLNALAAVEKVPTKFRFSFLHDVFTGWAERNPEEAAHYLKENRETFPTINAMPIVLSRWVVEDPEDAIKFLSTLSPRDEEEAFEFLLENFPHRDSAKFKRMASALTERQLKNSEFLSRFVQQWANQDPSAALAWISTLPPEEQKQWKQYEELASLPPLNSLVDLASDPDEMKNKVSQYPVWAQPTAWAMLLSEVASRKGTLEMIFWKSRNIPNDMDLETAIKESPFFCGFYDVEEDDPKKYEKIITEVPRTGSLNDFMISVPETYLKKFSARAPEETFSFINSIPNTTSSSLITELANLHYCDPKRAQPLIMKQASLTPATKKAILDHKEYSEPVMPIKKQLTNHE